VLHVSGPLALFRQTRIYARALASLIPRVTWCDSYEITAQCSLAPGADLVGVTIKSGDPIPTGRELQAYDSQVERRFARDFAKLATDWDIIREPEPIDVGTGLVFPDFALVHRQRAGFKAYLEIAGFWTRDYLDKKLASLKRAGIERLILCIDEKRCCGEGDFPARAEVIRYKRRIDAKQVLERLQAMRIR
jgi:predicted nuclease of restriction endonuclease-like RecB superfamily